MELNFLTLGKRIKTVRKRRGLSQQDLAEQINCAPSYISYIETGVRCMSLPFFIDLANELNVSADELLQDSLHNTIVVSNHDFSKLLNDCSEYERRILLEIAISAKDALRNNRAYLTFPRK